jgi:hypothetical protein
MVVNMSRNFQEMESPNAGCTRGTSKMDKGCYKWSMTSDNA